MAHWNSEIGHNAAVRKARLALEAVYRLRAGPCAPPAPTFLLAESTVRILEAVAGEMARTHGEDPVEVFTRLMADYRREG